MAHPPGTAFHDPLVGPEATDLPADFFDRLMFNLHPVDATTPSVIMGFGIYPPKDAVDGYVIVGGEHEQRNLRFSSRLGATDRDGAGPFRFEMLEPNQLWRLRLGPNEIGTEFDLTWRARTPAWFGEIAVTNTSAQRTSFDHLFQSGRYEGTLTIDGRTQSVDGWYGQRDRSRGVRTMAGGQGLHIWYQAQFPDFSVGFLLVETRSHERLLLEGAVMHENGRLDPITDVRHALVFTSDLDLVEGDVHVDTAAGEKYIIHADARAGGGYMAGAGYGGHHGNSSGADEVASERYRLDGSVSPRSLDSALTDRLCAFTLGDVRGAGIFEFALTRSSKYEYRPSL
ncbi:MULTISPECIES: DUF7064 domain-containing protein [Nocardia]|jgi:hypothetical protein|uniref:Uncharacterized protein n=2 Tax=Nocardia TaxID=1817 RepID=A0A2T2ZCB9_9NOCA|nr:MULTISPECIES: hypothetical protein [Nocardia]MDN2495393.1 hypothetical protein [Nocardia nova]PSR65376.1 hypothetical protein C8259_04365 [Nocardia nova]